MTVETTLLIVDDDPVNLDVLRGVLKVRLLDLMDTKIYTTNEIPPSSLLDSGVFKLWSS